MVYHIAQFCDWNTFVQLGNCNRFIRSICQQIMYKQIVRFIGPYVCKHRLHRFFDLLSETNSVVTGGIIHAMLLAFADPIYYTVKPYQLELIVPDVDGHAMSLWIRFFANLGFRSKREVETADPYSEFSRRTVILDNEVRLSFILTLHV
jgi:hypothetical protein